jgi:hypothetical protein
MDVAEDGYSFENNAPIMGTSGKSIAARPNTNRNYQSNSVKEKEGTEWHSGCALLPNSTV